MAQIYIAVGFNGILWDIDLFVAANLLLFQATRLLLVNLY
jgi:hypothetical protein